MLVAANVRKIQRERERIAKDLHTPCRKASSRFPAGHARSMRRRPRTCLSARSPLPHLHGVGNERLRRGLRAATQQAPHKRGKGTGNHECRKLPAKTR